jgi:flagellar motor switch protein FliN
VGAAEAAAPEPAPPWAGPEGQARLGAFADLCAHVAESAWAPLFGGGRVELEGVGQPPPAGALRTTAVVRAGEEAVGWIRVALEPAQGEAEAPAGAGRAQDRRALAAWLEGLGAAFGHLLGTPLEVRAVQAGERPEEVPGAEGTPVLCFRVGLSRRTGRAWLWLQPGLLGRCLAELLRDPPDGGQAGSEDGDGADPDPSGPATFPPLAEADGGAPDDRIEALLDVPLQVWVELGRTERPLRDILALVPGSIVQLDRLAGDPLDVFVNGRRVARAEVVVVDERFAVRITEIVGDAERSG